MEKPNKVFVVVNAGVAEVQQDTVPAGVLVEVIDMDTIRLGESFPSKEAFQYCQSRDFFLERRKKGGKMPGGRRKNDESTVPTV